MKYQKIYDAIIQRGKNRVLNEYFEKHHIIPKCMGGDNRVSNLVELTPEEHYVAHQLLVKIYPDNVKIAHAACLMSSSSKFNPRKGNKLFGWLKRRRSELLKGKKLGPASAERKAKISASNTGKVRSEETKQKIREARVKQVNVGGGRPKGYTLIDPVAEAQRAAKISASIKAGWSNRKKSNKMAEAAQNRLTFSCIKCHCEFKHARHFPKCYSEVA